MTNDFSDNYIIVHTFQQTWPECYNNATATTNVAMVAYIKCKKG